MNIDVAKLKNQTGASRPLEFTAELHPDALGYTGFIGVLPLHFSGQLENQERLLLLSGRLEAKPMLSCARCAEPVPFPLAVDFSATYSNDAELVAASEQADTDDVVHLFAGDSLEIDAELMQQIFLELPMKLLCRPDCRGLCPKCGQNLNHGSCRCAADDIDPRMEKLRELLSD
jgi:uncharacterized protein